MEMPSSLGRQILCVLCGFSPRTQRLKLFNAKIAEKPAEAAEGLLANWNHQSAAISSRTASFIGQLDATNDKA